jgi:hypothetical protein
MKNKKNSGGERWRRRRFRVVNFLNGWRAKRLKIRHWLKLNENKTKKKNGYKYNGKLFLSFFCFSLISLTKATSDQVNGTALPCWPFISHHTINMN